MRLMLLAATGSLAAIAAPAPAPAQNWSGTQFAASPTARSSQTYVEGRASGVSVRSGHRDGDRNRRRHHDRDGDFAGPWGWYGGDWAYYNNRTFAPDSYNDWWHDRPDRAFPRWMQNNQNCERLWWSGGGWRC